LNVQIVHQSPQSKARHDPDEETFLARRKVKLRFGEPPLQRTRSDGQAFKPTRQRRVLLGISAETATATSADVVADGTRYEWRIPVRATEARCAKIPAIVMVIRFRHVRS
jgi:hypothetical protein